jgi:tetrahydromethanopterin S-methyltransferase subunit B
MAAEMAVLAETAEMATVDKEIAEEKCKDLEDQIEELKQALDGAHHACMCDCVCVCR